MNKFLNLCFLSMLTLTACSVGQGKGSVDAPPPIANEQVVAPEPSPEEMMKMWTQYSTPSSGHEKLKQLEGKWKYTTSWWMKPEDKPEVSQGTSENRWILGKRFLEQNVRGKAMGQPFEGKGIVGFDNVTQEYNSVWVDNMGTGIAIAKGKLDAMTNTLVENGSATCPIAKGAIQFRGIWTLIDKNHHKYEMFTKDKNGKEFRSMEILYRRG